MAMTTVADFLFHSFTRTVRTVYASLARYVRTLWYMRKATPSKTTYIHEIQYLDTLDFVSIYIQPSINTIYGVCTCNADLFQAT